MLQNQNGNKYQKFELSKLEIKPVDPPKSVALVQQTSKSAQQSGLLAKGRGQRRRKLSDLTGIRLRRRVREASSRP